MYENELSNEGVLGLLNCKSFNQQILDLNIGKTGVTSKISKELLTFIHESKLEKLHIGDNPGLKFSFIVKLFELIQRNQSMFYLNIQGVDLYSDKIHLSSNSSHEFVIQNTALKTLVASN